MRTLSENADVRRVDRALTGAEFWQLYATIRSAKRNGPERAMFYLVAARTGLRWETVRKLTWSMLDLEQGEMDVPASVVKTKKGLRLPIEPTLLAELMAWRPVDAMPAKRLFRGMPAWRTWRHDLVAAGIEFETHEGRAERKCLRTTFAMELRDVGVPIEDIADLLGHSDIRITRKRYARPRLPNLARSVTKLPAKPADPGPSENTA